MLHSAHLAKIRPPAVYLPNLNGSTNIALAISTSNAFDIAAAGGGRAGGGGGGGRRRAARGR
jgi:hypothetical protein